MEKNRIPGSHPDMNLGLPDGDANSLVADSGKNWDNGYNFDERIDDDENDVLSSEAGRFDPEQAKEERQKRIEELKREDVNGIVRSLKTEDVEERLPELLDKGADMMTVLHRLRNPYATQKYSKTLIDNLDLLVEHGVNPNAKKSDYHNAIKIDRKSPDFYKKNLIFQESLPEEGVLLTPEGVKLDLKRIATNLSHESFDEKTEEILSKYGFSDLKIRILRHKAFNKKYPRPAAKDNFTETQFDYEERHKRQSERRRQAAEREREYYRNRGKRAIDSTKKV